MPQRNSYLHVTEKIRLLTAPGRLQVHGNLLLTLVLVLLIINGGAG